MREALPTPPVLAYPKAGEPFILDTDDYTPCEVMIVREMILPLESVFTPNSPEPVGYGEFITNLQRRMREVLEIVTARLKKELTFSKRRYDRPRKFNVG